MDGLFSVDEEIDFSDDELSNVNLNFNSKNSNKKNGTICQSSEVSASKSSESSVTKNTMCPTRLSNLDAKANRQTANKKFTFRSNKPEKHVVSSQQSNLLDSCQVTKKQLNCHLPKKQENCQAFKKQEMFDKFLIDDDDDLLSQIEQIDNQSNNKIDVSLFNIQNNVSCTKESITNNIKKQSPLHSNVMNFPIPSSRNVSSDRNMDTPSNHSFTTKQINDISTHKKLLKKTDLCSSNAIDNASTKLAETHALSSSQVQKCPPTVVHTLSPQAQKCPPTVVHTLSSQVQKCPPKVVHTLSPHVQKCPPTIVSMEQNKKRAKRKSNDVFNMIANKTPSRQRKFPGPAGMLPKLTSNNDLNVLKSPEVLQNKRTLTPLTPKTPIHINPSQDEEFSYAIWKDIKTEVHRFFPNTQFDGISSLIQKATMNQLPRGKVDVLFGVIKTFSITGSSGVLILKDPSGEINGTVHKSVLEEFEPELKPGTGLILKDVSVFSPTSKKHYVNIIPSNIVHLFPTDLNETVNQSQFSEMSQANNKENINVNGHPVQTSVVPGDAISRSSPRRSFVGQTQFGFENDEAIDDFFSDDIITF